MTCYFGDLNFTHLLVYLDDLIIFSKTFEHLERLQLVFDQLQEHGLKLKPSKCQLIRQEVQYLGHLVSAAGVQADPEKISRVKDWVRSTNKEQGTRKCCNSRGLLDITGGMLVDTASLL